MAPSAAVKFAARAPVSFLYSFLLDLFILIDYSSLALLPVESFSGLTLLSSFNATCTIFEQSQNLTKPLLAEIKVKRGMFPPSEFLWTIHTYIRFF